MTRDDMLRMAWEAGLVRFEGGELEAYGVGKASPSDHSVAAWSVATEQKLAHFFALATAAELRRLHADAEESEALRERLSALLRNTAIALRGPEPELTRWSWHDLPELATALKAQRDAIQQVVDEQAKDEGLWFRAETAAEAYLQQELRRLHAAVEGAARAAITKAEEA